VQGEEIWLLFCHYTWPGAWSFDQKSEAWYHPGSYSWFSYRVPGVVTVNNKINMQERQRKDTCIQELEWLVYFYHFIPCIADHLVFPVYEKIFMNQLDWIVLIVTLLATITYGLYKSRTSRNLDGYFLSNRSMPWGLVLLSIMGTQASAITLFPHRARLIQTECVLCRHILVCQLPWW
jgi:hypothetical protein